MKLTLIKAFIACSIFVMAQVPQGFGQLSFILLQQEDVRKELALTPSQIKDVDAVLAPLYRTAPNGKRGLYIGRDTNVQEIQSRATQCLTEGQKKRLAQIQMWVKGGRILLDPDIAKELQLTPDQVKAIQAIDAEMSQEIRSLAGNGTRQITIRPELADKYAGRMLKVLTTDQRHQFDKMRGKPFKGAGK